MAISGPRSTQTTVFRQNSFRSQEYLDTPMLDQAQQGIQNLIEKRRMIFEARKRPIGLRTLNGWASALQSIHQFIRERLSMENQAIINTSTNAYETLRLLKNRLHPSDESSKFGVKRQWHMLPLVNSWDQEWEKYVNTWSNVYRRGKSFEACRNWRQDAGYSICTFN